MVLADWFQPNLVDAAWEACVEEHGGMLLRIPGHLAGHVQAHDTRLHGPLSAHYKRAETADAQAHL
eukprot:6697532-Alexandrium_andersonii.AAC.1